ncbi:outer membrane protein [Maribacter litoralis]|uniref:outer membrane protein n=1 Tax=Maribacter litoralis TaxID=2059726 RepID=UPI000E314043|nr:outer membrane beta-barrel protein [Maribacter litoralis]
MKRLLLTSFLVLTSIITNAQDQKWSVEANYPLNVSDDLGFSELNGVVDLGIKYRFVELGAVNIGVGISAAYLKNQDEWTYFDQENVNVNNDYKVKKLLIQPKVFAELAIPGFAKLKPQIALGYSIVKDDYYYKSGNNSEVDNNSTDGGLNLNLGLSYDISNRFFIQIQYDYLNVNVNGDTVINGETFSYNYDENGSLIKAGVGFRF